MEWGRVRGGRTAPAWQKQMALRMAPVDPAAAATLQTGLAAPPKVTHSHHVTQEFPCWACTQRNESVPLHKGLSRSMCGGIIHNHQRTNTTQMSIRGQVHKHHAVHPSNTRYTECYSTRKGMRPDTQFRASTRMSLSQTLLPEGSR